MSDPISDLLGIIRQEIGIYRELAEHARSKTALLVQGTVEAILESNKAEEAFASKLSALEAEMKRLCQELTQSLRIPREEFTLTRLADNLEQSLAGELRSQIILLRNAVKYLKAVSRRNMKIIEKSIHYSRNILALLCNASGSYRQNGLLEQLPPIQPVFSQRG
ncbi:MAG: hypothetical protein H6Q07_3088 [Acidobacteria bacterium]|nr:hypothetical protein [Acidobacteriota bacterium]